MNREREEVSAFFLHGNAPNMPEARVRNGSIAAMPSSADGATADASSHNSGHRHPSDQPVYAFETGVQSVVASEKERKEQSEASKATSCFSWTTSRESSNTRARQALLDTGIFNNTGIQYEAQGAKVNNVQGSGKLTTPRQHKASSTSLDATQAYQDKSIRIVRYQDRGTQHDRPYTHLDKHMQDIYKCDAASLPHDKSQTIPAEQTLEAEKRVQKCFGGPGIMPTNGVLWKPLPRSKETCMPGGPSQANEMPSANNANGEERDARLKRPASPKLSIVERLEAMANIHAQQAAECEAAQNARHDDGNSGSPARSLESMPLSYGSAHCWPTRAARAGSIRDRAMPMPSTSCFAFKVSARPSIRDTVTDEKASLAQPYGPADHLAIQAPPSSLSKQARWPVGQYEGGIREYIDQIEQEMVNGLQDDLAFGPETLVDLDGIDFEERSRPAHQQSPSQVGVHSSSRTSATISKHNYSGSPQLEWTRTWDSENTEEEERRFLSSFWRPNRHNV